MEGQFLLAALIPHFFSDLDNVLELLIGENFSREYLFVNWSNIKKIL